MLEVMSVEGDIAEGDMAGWEDVGVEGGEGGDMVRWGFIGFIPSLCFSSVFSSCRDALSSWSFVLNSWSREFSSTSFCLSSFIWLISFSISSHCAFFLSLAFCAATLFLSFRLISLSSGDKWSRLALFLTGANSSSSSSSSLISLMSNSGERGGAGLLHPTTVATGRETGELMMALLAVWLGLGLEAITRNFG